MDPATEDENYMQYSSLDDLDKVLLPKRLFSSSESVFSDVGPKSFARTDPARKAVWRPQLRRRRPSALRSSPTALTSTRLTAVTAPLLTRSVHDKNQTSNYFFSDDNPASTSNYTYTPLRRPRHQPLLDKVESEASEPGYVSPPYLNTRSRVKSDNLKTGREDDQPRAKKSAAKLTAL